MNMADEVRKIDVDANETNEEFEWFYKLIQSSYGPFGKCALFPTPTGGGGVVCLTSRAEKLLQMIKTRNPALRVIVGGLEGHVSNYRDSGLYAALLALDLVMRGLRIQKPRLKVANVTSHTLSMVSEWLRSDDCPCKVSLSLSSSRQLMTLVRASITSKSYKFGLTSTQVDHISSLLLQAFLLVLPKEPMDSYSFPAHIHMLSQSGSAVEKSGILQGVALVTSDVQLMGQIEGDLIKRTNDRGILTAVFDVSLAGDLEEDLIRDLTLCSTSVSVGGRESLEAIALDNLLRLTDCLLEKGVRLVGCQKCVHPLVKERLREHGVLIVERLSSVHIQSVLEVTGGQVNSLLTSDRIHLGRLQSVRLAQLGNDKFVVLEGLPELVTPHCTVVLCTPTESMGEELVPLCKNIICLLEQSLTSPYSFCGGGCTDTVISWMIQDKAKEDVGCDVLEEIECDQTTYHTILKSISKCFSVLASSLEHCGGMTLTDSSTHHCWSFPPYDYCTPLSVPIQSSAPHNHSLLDGGRPSNQPVTPTPTAIHRLSDSQLKALSKKTCCCGTMSVRNLPPGTEWTSALTNDSASVPDQLYDSLRSVTTGHYYSGGGKPDIDCARVLDFGLAKVRAVETAGDVASTVLHIAYSLTSRHDHS